MDKWVEICPPCLPLCGGLMFACVQAEAGSDPLQAVTSIDLTVPPEKVADITGFLVDVINPSIMELRRLFLLESIFDTIKFILCLWGLTYIGSWFVFSLSGTSIALNNLKVQYDDPHHSDMGWILHSPSCLQKQSGLLSVVCFVAFYISQLSAKILFEAFFAWSSSLILSFIIENSHFLPPGCCG